MSNEINQQTSRMVREAHHDIQAHASTDSGLLKFARYAYQPNFLQYCGGMDPRYLFDCVVEGQVDRGLTELLVQFEGALPYLKLIAEHNRIADPFDERVVDAYWIGNSLLQGVSLKAYYDHLTERFKGKVSPQALKHLVTQVPAGALPHHSFHVIDVCTRTGSLAQSLEVLDRCRISWGTVQKVEGDHVLVQTQRLVWQDAKIQLGAPELQTWQWAEQGRGFVSDLKVNDLLTAHWGWVCERVSVDTVGRLEKYTRQNVGVANGMV